MTNPTQTTVTVQPGVQENVVVILTSPENIVTVNAADSSQTSTQTQNVTVEELAIRGLQGPQGDPGPAGQGNLTDSTPVPVSIGGIAAGTTFDNVPLQDVLAELLYPYQTPAGSLSIQGQANPVEVGTTVTGSKVFSWSFSNPANIVAGSVVLKDGGTVLASGKDAIDTATVAINITTSTPNSHTWTVTGTDIKGHAISASVSITWQWENYHGVSALTTLDGSDIIGLSAALAGGFAGTYSLVAGNYKYLCFPASFGPASSFTDTATQLSVTMADATDDAFYANTDNGLSYGAVTVTNNQGAATTYRVYRTRFKLGGSINIRVG